MTPVQAFFLFIAALMLAAVGLAWLIVWLMYRKELNGYDHMARTMRRMKDEDPEALRTIAPAFKDVFKP